MTRITTCQLVYHFVDLLSLLPNERPKSFFSISQRCGFSVSSRWSDRLGRALAFSILGHAIAVPVRVATETRPGVPTDQRSCLNNPRERRKPRPPLPSSALPSPLSPSPPPPLLLQPPPPPPSCPRSPQPHTTATRPVPLISSPGVPNGSVDWGMFDLYRTPFAHLSSASQNPPPSLRQRFRAVMLQQYPKQQSSILVRVPSPDPHQSSILLISRHSKVGRELQYTQLVEWHRRHTTALARLSHSFRNSGRS